MLPLRPRGRWSLTNVEALVRDAEDHAERMRRGEGGAKSVIKMTKAQRLKAMPILHRGTPVMILRGGIYIVDQYTVDALRQAGVSYTLMCRDPVRRPEGAFGERI